MGARCRIGRRGFAVMGLFVLVSGVAASGHRPVAIGEVFPTRGEALVIEDESVSQVAYVPLSEERNEAWLRLDVESPSEVFVSLGVPVIERLVDYRPTLRVIGPEGEGERILIEERERETPRRFHEPITNTESWIHIERWVEWPEAGTYYIVASASSGEADKLWVSVGQREVFGVSDVLSLPQTIREVRAFHEVSAAATVEPRTWASLLAVLVVGAIIVFFAARSGPIG